MQDFEHNKYQPTGRMVLRKIGKDQLLVPVSGAIARTNAVFPLNATAAFIWSRITGGETADQIAHALAQEFAVSPEQAASDVHAFVQRLLSEQLLEPVAS